MIIGWYPRRTSGDLTVDRLASQAIMIRSCHVCRHDTLPKIILQGTVNGSRGRGRSRKSWKDNIKEWTGQSMSSLLRIEGDRGRCAVIAADTSVCVHPINDDYSVTGIISQLILQQPLDRSAKCAFQCIYCRPYSYLGTFCW